ncbi:hypothetical protein CEXT_295921 [Caerostris extrusa]|uniref:Uncharacterized protein n=1 Tax=Caerostris extrusa TaxID=172846 RepID=A0AAV4MF43_CAEEX|nr:hypothetical protein CEXT_295921 [Caerostris extrusa]
MAGPRNLNTNLSLCNLRAEGWSGMACRGRRGVGGYVVETKGVSGFRVQMLGEDCLPLFGNRPLISVVKDKWQKEETKRWTN